MNPLKKLAGQTAIYGIPSIVGRFLNYLLVPLYTYGLLTQQEYGVVSLFYSYTALMMVILTYGMETAFFRFSETESDKNRVYSTALISLTGSSLVFLLVVTLFSGTVAGWLGYPDDATFVVWFAWIMALDAITAIPFARLRALNRPVWFSTVKSINIFSNILFNLFFLLLCPWLANHWQGSGAGYALGYIYRSDWVIEYIFISNLLASALSLILLSPALFRISLQFDAALLKRMLIYSLPLMLAGFAGIINENVDRILLRYLLPLSPADAEAQVGIYSACYKIAVLMTLFIQAYKFAAEPFFFSQMKNADAQKMYARIMDYFIIAVSAIFLVTMLFLDTIFIRLTGPEFRGARAIIPVLMLAKLFLGVYYNLSIWYKLTGKTLWGAFITMVGALVTIGLNFILIPLPSNYLIHGYMGPAVATLACYTLMMVMAYVIGQRYYPVPYSLKKFFGYTGFSVFLFFIHEWIRQEHFMIDAGTAAVLLFIFAFVVYRLERKRFASSALS